MNDTTAQLKQLRDLPPQRQTQVIRQAMRTGQDTVYITLPDHGNITVEIPEMLRVTFQCEKCNTAHDVFFYRGDVLKNHVAKAVQCSQRGCHGQAFIAFMGAPW